MESRFQLEPTFFQFLYSIKDGHDTVPHAAERPARRNSTMISGVVVSARTKCPCTMHYDTCSFAYVSATMPSRHISRSVACPYEYSIKDGYDTVKYMKVDCRTSEKKFQVVQS